MLEDVAVQLAATGGMVSCSEPKQETQPMPLPATGGSGEQQFGERQEVVTMPPAATGCGGELQLAVNRAS